MNDDNVNGVDLGRVWTSVAAEVWRLKTYDLAASRRLVLAAQKSGTPGLMVPAGAAGGARHLSSAARTRFEVRAMPGPRAASAGGRTPLPGFAAWELRIARIRAGPDGAGFALDQNRFWPVLWDHEEAFFRDAFPLPVSAQARDRPDQAPGVAWPAPWPAPWPVPRPRARTAGERA